MDTLGAARAFLDEIEPIFNRPEFAHWNCGSASISSRLVQFQPAKVMDKPPAEGGEWRPSFDVKQEARVIARLLGGHWSRCGSDWRAEITLGSGRRVEVLLHSVEPEEKIQPIDL